MIIFEKCRIVEISFGLILMKRSLVVDKAVKHIQQKISIQT